MLGPCVHCALGTQVIDQKVIHTSLDMKHHTTWHEERIGPSSRSNSSSSHITINHNSLESPRVDYCVIWLGVRFWSGEMYVCGQGPTKKQAQNKGQTTHASNKTRPTPERVKQKTDQRKNNAQQPTGQNHKRVKTENGPKINGSTEKQDVRIWIQIPGATYLGWSLAITSTIKTSRSTHSPLSV